MKTDTYKLGFGKTLWQQQFKNTVFSAHMLPFGAHVELNAHQFNNLPFYKKILIILGGPAINFILAFILFFIFLGFIGQPSSPPVIAGVEVDYVAEKAGFKAGDRILKINDKEITRYEEVLETTKSIPIKELVFEIERGSELKEITIMPQEISYISDQGIHKKHARIGVLGRHTPYDFSVLEEVNGVIIEDRSFDTIKKILTQNFDKNVVLGLNSTDKTVHFYRTYISKSLNKKYFIDDDKDKFILGKQGENFYLDLTASSALTESYRQTITLLQSILSIPMQLFPIDGGELSPETIVIKDGFDITGKCYKFVFMASLLSIIIGIINLIPVGYLDGGKILTLLIEKFTDKTMTAKQIGFMTLVVLMSLYGAIIIMNYSNFTIYIAHLFDF